MLIAVMLASAIALTSIPGAEKGTQDKPSLASSPAIDECSTWFASRTSSSNPAVLTTGTDTFCFDGVIDARGSAALIDRLKSVQADRPTTMVVRSGGGDISESLDVAEVLVGKDVTVIVHTLCGSGCANNLFLPVRRA